MYTEPAHNTCLCAESGLTQLQMVVMSDTDDPFVPLPDDLLVNLAESRALVEALLDSLPTTFSGNAQVLLASCRGHHQLSRHRFAFRALHTQNVSRPTLKLELSRMCSTSCDSSIMGNRLTRLML